MSFHLASVGGIAGLIGFLSARHVHVELAWHLMPSMLLGIAVFAALGVWMYQPREAARQISSSWRSVRNDIKVAIVEFRSMRQEIARMSRQKKNIRTTMYTLLINRTILVRHVYVGLLCLTWLYALAIPLFVDSGDWLLTYVTVCLAGTTAFVPIWYVVHLVVTYGDTQNQNVQFVLWSLVPQLVWRKYRASSTHFAARRIRHDESLYCPGICLRNLLYFHVRERRVPEPGTQKIKVTFSEGANFLIAQRRDLFVRYNPVSLAVRLCIWLARLVPLTPSFVMRATPIVWGYVRIVALGMLRFVLRCYRGLNSVARRAIFACSCVGFFAGWTAQWLGAHATSPFWCFGVGFVFGCVQNWIFQCLKERISAFLERPSEQCSQASVC